MRFMHSGRGMGFPQPSMYPLIETKHSSLSHAVESKHYKLVPEFLLKWKKTLGLEKHIELETDYLSYCSGDKRVGFIVDTQNEEKERRK